MPQENSTLDREHFGPGDACAAGRDGTGPAVVVFDAEAMVVGINAEAEALLGRPAAEIVGQPLDTVIASGPQEWQALLAGDPKPEDMARAFRDSPLPHGAAGAPLNAAAVRCEPDQRPLWVAVLRDVAICSDMETALLEAEERLAGITANMPGIIFQRAMHPDGTIYYPFFTAGVRDVLGYPPDDIRVNAEGCLHFVHWADRESHLAAIRRSAGDLTPCEEEFRAITLAGEVRWLRGTSRPNRMADGGTLWDGVLIDVTDRKRVEQRLEMIMDHAADCIITIDDAGHMESVNAAVEALFGYSTEEMVGQSVSILMPEPYRSHHDRYIAQYVETGEGKMIGGGPRELVGQRKDGSTFPLEMSTSEVRAEGRRLFIGIGRDITLRKRTEDALRETEQRLRVIAGNLPGIVFQRLLKPDGSLVYTYVSEGSRDVLGIEPAALIADADLFLNMMEPHHRQRYMASLLRSAQTREPVDEEVRVTTPAGRVLWLRGQSRPRLLPSGDIAFDGLTLDVTDRKLAEERLRFLAYYDPVTGLANRSLFLDRFALARAHATSDGTSVAVLSLGIDRFSIINTTMGHAVGDQVLAALAQRLQSCLGLNDIVARAGGDRFLIMITGLASDREMTETVEIVLGRAQEPLSLGNEEFDLTVCIGVAVSPRNGDDPELLIRHADGALMRAKGVGPGTIQFFTEEMAAQATRTLSLHNRLRRAIENEEITAFYQPQVDVTTGHVVGMEALARWISPEHGMISPGEFIPVAEEYGLIEALCEQVLRQACRQNKAWQQADLAHVPVAVNISGRQFQHSRRMVYMLESMLDETGLEARYLELELTESSAMRDADTAIAVLEMLRDMGLVCSIDDFGTGYSSLSVLKRFPINKLKIDRSFVMDVTTDVNDAAIVTAIIAMAHALRLKVVAEGVEEVPHLDFLRGLGCDQIQGYLFSRPLPAAEMGRLFAQGKRLAVSPLFRES